MAGTSEVPIPEFLRSLCNPLEALSLKHLLVFDFQANHALQKPQKSSLIVIALALNNFLAQNYVGNFNSRRVLRDFEEFIDPAQLESQVFCKIIEDFVPEHAGFQHVAFVNVCK